MSKSNTNLSPKEVIHRIFEYAETALERAIIENNHKTSCVRGCAYCCHQPVFVTPLEALAVSLAVEKLDEESRRQLELRIEDYKKILTAVPNMQDGVDATRLELCGLGPGPTKEQFAALYGPACPFLVNNKCSIYESRPLMCREHTSLDNPDKCKNDEPFFGLPAALFNEVPASLCTDFIPDEMIFMPVWDYEISAEAALDMPLIESDFLDQILSWKLQALGLLH